MTSSTSQIVYESVVGDVQPVFLFLNFTSTNHDSRRSWKPLGSTWPYSQPLYFTVT